jgi:hypothetical protein
MQLRRGLSRSLLVCGVSLAASGASALNIQPTGMSAGSPSQPTYQVSFGAADVGQSFTIDWLLDRRFLSDLTATASFTIESFSQSSIALAVSITNTTSSWLDRVAIASIGLGVSPNATGSLLAAGSVFDSVGSGSGPHQNYPGGFKGIDVCIFAQNCSGGGVRGLLGEGATDSFRVALGGDFSGGSATLSSFAAKFQTAFGSYQLAGRPTPGRPIPEPEAIVVFLAGLAVLGAAVRRKRSSH